MSTTTAGGKIRVPSFLADLDISSSPQARSPTSQKRPDDDSSRKNPNTIQTIHSLPQETRKSLLNHLDTTDSVSPLNNLLTTTLVKSTTTNPAGAADWSARVNALALELLRSGACAPTFHDLMDEITRRALKPHPPPTPPPPPPPSTTTSTHNGSVRGRNGVVKNGLEARIGTIVLPSGSYDEDGLPDVRMPRDVVESGIRFLEEKIKGNIEIVEDDGKEERGEEEEEEG